MNHEQVLILDFGGQYSQLLARRVREDNVYCEVLPYDTSIEKIKNKNPKGIILTGGPNIIYDEEIPTMNKEIFDLEVPVLGVCYGYQIIGRLFGGQLTEVPYGEYRKVNLFINQNHPLFKEVDQDTIAWSGQTHYFAETPQNFESIAHTDSIPVAAMANDKKKIYGVQFHPEVNHTSQGIQMIHNFLYQICGCTGDWTMEDFAEASIETLRKQIGDKKVLCALSGGVDSSVAAVLIHKAIGKQLTCILVDHGLMRKNEANEVEKTFKEQFDMNLIRVNAQDRFLTKLAGVTDPETKRKIIGEEFIRVFEEEAKKIGAVDYLVQGTIYPDIIESGGKHAATIKSHHNVGGLPDHVDFKEIIEPLRELFKDEVRALGRVLGIPEFLVSRQPFPGPGLAIRVIGDITKEKLDILREADFIYREEIAKAKLDKEIWQYFAVLTNLRSVGVTGDERTYHYTLALRGVISIDGMTADWARIPHEVLNKISMRITKEVPNINRVVYDITSKPPATIEWE